MSNAQIGKLRLSNNVKSFLQKPGHLNDWDWLFRSFCILCFCVVCLNVDKQKTIICKSEVVTQKYILSVHNKYVKTNIIEITSHIAFKYLLTK